MNSDILTLYRYHRGILLNMKLFPSLLLIQIVAKGFLHWHSKPLQLQIYEHAVQWAKSLSVCS